MITWNTAAQTLLDAAAAGTAQVEVTVLLYIGFTVPQRYVLNSKPKDWGGYTWAGVEFGIQPIDDSADARNALGFSFPGVTSAELSLALHDLARHPKTQARFDARAHLARIFEAGLH